MDHLLSELTGLVAVTLIFGGGIISSMLATWQRRMELKAQQQQGQNDLVTRELTELRAEVAALRDTSTQFDVSLDASVNRLEGRVNRLETMSSSRVAAPAEAPNQQVGSR